MNKEKEDPKRLNEIYESKSLKELKKRFAIAKKFNFKISLQGIRLTKDVINFIKTHDLCINDSKTSLSIVFNNAMHISSKVFSINHVKQQSLLYNTRNTKTKKDIVIENTTIHHKSNYIFGAESDYSHEIYINLQAIYNNVYQKMDKTFFDKLIVVITHEIMHRELDKIDIKTSIAWDNIAYKLKDYSCG